MKKFSFWLNLLAGVPVIALGFWTASPRLLAQETASRIYGGACAATNENSCGSGCPNPTETWSQCVNGSAADHCSFTGASQTQCGSGCSKNFPQLEGTCCS